MADESVRIEVAFDGGQILGVAVTPAGADAIERALNAGGQGALQLDTEEARVTVVLTRVVYVKRFARQGTPGFGI